MQSEKKSPRQILYLFMAFLVAAGIWLYADQTNNGNGSPRTITREIKGVPITYTSVDTVLADRGLMLLDEGTDATIDLTLKGGRWMVNVLDASDIRVTCDLGSIANSGVQRASVSISVDPKYGQVTKQSLYMATVNISELYSKTVDVKCEMKGNVAEGYSAGQLQLSVEKLEIRGQAEDIDPVSYAKVTLDLGKDAVETVSKTLTWQFYDENDQLMAETGIHPTVESVQATLPVYVTKDLRLVVDFKEYPGARARNLDVKIEPQVITVSGDAAQLRDVETITLAEFDLLELLGDNATNRHSYPIIIPDGCQNLNGVTRATLTVSFKDMTSAEVVANRFEVANVPEGKRARILTEELPVTVFGTAADVEAVTGDDVTMIADLSDYSGASGTYTVPATVRIGTSGDVGVTGVYQVQVTIQEQQEQPEEDTPQE
nr:CdaR family protein [uncultured Dysosmobacter sp.]